MTGKTERAFFAGAETLLSRLQDATQLMMLKTCLTKTTALMSLHGMLQQTAMPLAAAITGTFQKRLVDRLLTGISGGQGMAMLTNTERFDCCLLPYSCFYLQYFQVS